MINNDYIYDIETYVNMFSVGIVKADTNERWIFEVSPRINQSARFVEFIYYLRDINARMFGYNNEGFDWIVCQHLVDIFTKQGYFTETDAYNKAQEIFKTQNDNRYHLMIWPDQRIVKQGDLFKIHHFDNFARSTSLKKLEINMRSQRVVDLPHDPHIPLTSEQADEVIAYMCDDINATRKFYFWSLDKIKFRDELAIEYPNLGDVLNFNDTKIGKRYFEVELEKKSPGICYTKIGYKSVARQTHRPTIALADVVFPYVRFDTPEFNAILNRLKSSVITETKGVFTDLKTVVDGVEFSLGLGGIHGARRTSSEYADSEYDIIDADVSSYYPNIAIRNRLFPEHLSEDFCDIYQDVYNMRKKYKKNTAQNLMLKLALNGVYGSSGATHGPFRDTKYMMATTINGQLLLLMLSELFMKAGLKVLQVNTDGVTCLVHKSKRSQFTDICASWEKLTGLDLEFVDYVAVHQRDVNCYIAVKSDGSVKRKSAYGYLTPMDDPYTTECEWHKDHSNLVSRKAAEARLVHGQDVTDFIMSHRDPFDFMKSVKVPKSSSLEERWSDGRIVPIQNTSRYYVSTKGCALAKVMPPLKGKPNSRTMSVEKGWAVKVVNDASNFDWSDVNWLYYIDEAKKLTSWVN